MKGCQHQDSLWGRDLKKFGNGLFLEVTEIDVTNLLKHGSRF